MSNPHRRQGVVWRVVQKEALKMREISPWFIVLGLVLALVLIVGSAQRAINISLPLAVVIGLGINAAWLLWHQRQRLADILGGRKP